DGAKSVSVTSTLGTGGITSNSQTSIPISNASAFPSTDTTTNGPWASHFLIQISTEWMLVTNRTSNTLTVVRGALTTTPLASVAAGTTVTAYFGSHGIRNFLGDLQINYNNFNNPAGKHGCPIYADCHTVIYTTHAAA